ncbi:hypothetical protein S83_057048 [Arachis hypogaea]
MQAVLSRLLSAAAPLGHTTQENRRQCLNVLRLWLERRILPQSIIRCHIRELDTYHSSAGVYSRRMLPVREMEATQVFSFLDFACLKCLKMKKGVILIGGTLRPSLPSKKKKAGPISQAFILDLEGASSGLAPTSHLGASFRVSTTYFSSFLLSPC